MNNRQRSYSHYSDTQEAFCKTWIASITCFYCHQQFERNNKLYKKLFGLRKIEKLSWWNNTKIRTSCTIHCRWGKTKLFNIRRNLFLLMLNLQQDSREKQTQQKEESGKIASCHWIMDGNGDAIINSSPFWCNGRKLLNFSTRGIGCN